MQNHSENNTEIPNYELAKHMQQGIGHVVTLWLGATIPFVVFGALETTALAVVPDLIDKLGNSVIGLFPFSLGLLGLATMEMILRQDTNKLAQQIKFFEKGKK